MNTPELLARVNEVIDRLVVLVNSLQPGVDVSMTTEEACNFLKVSPDHLAILRKAGILPYQKIGKSVTYKLSDLCRYRDQQTVGGDYNAEPNHKKIHSRRRNNESGGVQRAA